MLLESPVLIIVINTENGSIVYEHFLKFYSITLGEYPLCDEEGPSVPHS